MKIWDSVYVYDSEDAPILSFGHSELLKVRKDKKGALKVSVNSAVFNPAVVAWFVRASVSHSVDSEFNRTVDPSPLAAPYLYVS